MFRNSKITMIGRAPTFFSRCLNPRVASTFTAGPRTPGQVSGPTSVRSMNGRPVFDCDALLDAVDAQGQERHLGCTTLPPSCGSSQRSSTIRTPTTRCAVEAIRRSLQGGATSCPYALFMLRRLGRTPEDFLTGPVVDVALPTARSCRTSRTGNAVHQSRYLRAAPSSRSGPCNASSAPPPRPRDLTET